MPHPSQFNRSRGGKKGPRQVTSKRQVKITLRPAPARDPAAPADKDDEFELDDDDDDEPEEPAYGYREALRGERLPLQGLKVSVSGCGGLKEDLLALVQTYGGQRHGGLQEDTTHLVTDTPAGKKYDVALQRRVHVMKASWLPALRDAWISGEDADFAQIELDHAMPPLYGVNVCLTGFAKGQYKEDLKTLLTSNGATIAIKLDSRVTHLLVASPSSPHSQTPTSDKLLHARKNRHRLHADFVAVWEGWAREAVKYGGIRPERTHVWEHKEGGEEPQEDVSWQVEWVPPRCRSTRPRARSPNAASAFAPRAGSSDPAGRAGRSLVPVPGTYQPRPAFKGYDTSLLDGLDAADPTTADKPTTAFDLAHGKVLKKRHRLLAADSGSQLAPSASHAAPQHAQDDSQALLEAFGASQNPAGEASRFADADATGLPSIGELLAARSRMDEEPVGEMSLQLVPGQVEMQLVPKGKSVIKALSSSRHGSFVHDARDDNPRRLAAATAARRDGVEQSVDEAGAIDDSAFFDSAPLQAVERKASNVGTTDEWTSSPSSEETVYLPIFEGKTFALMELKSPRIKGLKRVIGKCSGRFIDNAVDDELASADFVIVDHVEPPEQFAHSNDPRIRTVCWIELCIFHDELLEPADRLLERPITYACPVPGLDGFRIHFSGFGPEEEPVMHHFKRFCAAVGMTYSSYMDRTTTHLVVRALEDDPSLRPEDLDAAQFPKVAKAREWGLAVYSLRELRQVVQARADEVEREKALASGGERMRWSASAKGKGREVREITNEVEGPEHNMQGPLSECVVFFSSKIDVDRQHLASVVQDLGGVAARQYSESVTHFIHAGVKASEPFKDFKVARADGAHIVHPHWIEECWRTQAHVSEKDFPHTFDARKGGQLFNAGMSMHATTSSLRASPVAKSRDTSGEGAPARSPSKLALGIADGSQPRSPSAALGHRSAEAARLDTQAMLEEAGDVPPSPSPSPARRRRSDTTATEIADTADLGGFDDHALMSPQPGPADSSAPSSPRRALPRSELSQPEVSSDPFELPPLRSEMPAPPAAEDSSKNMLRQQTSLLLAQLSEVGPQVDKSNRMRSRTALNRGKSSGTISLANSKDLSPLAAANDGSTSASVARRVPGQAYALDPSQATQDESLYVVYDNVAEAAAREQIRRALAGDGAEPVMPEWQDPVGARTRRARAAKRSFAMDADDEDLLVPPPLPEKESIWRRVNIHLSDGRKGQYAAVEQQERLLQPRPASYIELNMVAQRSPKLGASPEPESQRPPPRKKPIAACCWLLGAMLVGAAAASLFHHASAVAPPSTVCPDPRLPLAPSLHEPRHRSTPISLPSASPDFTLSLVHDTAVCNAFELTISRIDESHCLDMETRVEPSRDAVLSAWIKEHLGPDAFHIQLDGAERRAETVPTQYLGKCEYMFRFRLNNAGRVWMNVTLMHEDYEGFKEVDVEKGSRPRPKLLLQPLVESPLELNLCSDSCTPFIPPRIGTTSGEPYGLSVFPASTDSRLAVRPDCSSLPPLRSPLGHYIPSNSHDLVYPPLPLPIAHSRPMAGLYTFVPSSCTREHDGLRFRDHSSCLVKEHSVLLLGDSHARTVFDVVKHRLEGNDSVEDKSMKADSKHSHIGNLYLNYVWDPFLESDVDCDFMRQFDTITVSTGSHDACWNCPSTAAWLASLSDVFSTWPSRIAACHTRSARPKKPRFIFLNIPATHPLLHNHDCRTGPRLAYWNERAAELASEHGWEVVDVEEYSKPGAIDTMYGDGVHYLGLDAAEPVVDDYLDRLGICGKSGTREP
ncbi:hypothetical protein JCM3770_002019 [Rhodotorula araucariae]